MPKKIDYMEQVIVQAKEARRACFALRNHCRAHGDKANADRYDSQQAGYRGIIERAEHDIELLKRAN
jgi:hypothetical protein